MQGHPKKGLGLFRHLTFRQETFRQTFHHGEFSPQEHFGMGIFWHHGRFDTGTLPHWDILEHGHFGTWKFQHRGTGAEMSILLYTVPKCTFAKTSLCWNILVVKYPSVVTSLCRNIHGAEIYPCQNILMPKSPCDEMSVLKCLLPKCQVPK